MCLAQNPPSPRAHPRGTPRSPRALRRGLLAGVLAFALLAGACGGDDDTEAKSDPEKTTKTTKKAAAKTSEKEEVTLRLGYFPNVTHAAAVAGVEKGIFADTLGKNVKLETATFNAGPAAVEALFANALDATYIGPNPAINAFSKSNGKAIRIIAGATSGGASLVVKPSITKAADLKGKKLASPQLGGTQDVALRAWLLEKGLKSDTSGGGDVAVLPQDNAQTLEQFKAGTVAGGWLPEPWATRLVQEGGGKVLVDERDLWPEGQFVTTHLIVRTKFADDHPDVIKKLLEAHLAATGFVNGSTEEAQEFTNQGIEKITGKALPAEVITAAWEKLSFTYDPLAPSLFKGAELAKSVGLLDKATKLDGIYSLDALNEVLEEAGQETIELPDAEASTEDEQTPADEDSSDDESSPDE